jgi:hypothetical protein
MRVLLVRKRQISWQEQDLNIHSQDLNQLAASQLELSRKRSVTGLKQAKGFILEPSARRIKDLLKLNRDQLRWVVVLFTGYCRLNGNLFTLGLTDVPICEQCLEKDESATHILCDCEAIAYLRFHHLGQFLMEPSESP